MDKELSREIEYFNSHKQEWAEHYQDKYALIKGEELIGTFDSKEDAFKIAIEKFGSVSVLIKKITLQEEEPEELPALALGMTKSFF